MNDSILAIHPKANFRIMSANLLFDESAEARSPIIFDNIMYYRPDIVGFQEVNRVLYANVIEKLAQNGYAITSAQPDPDNMRDSEKASLNKKYPSYNFFPIAYRTDLYQEVESEFVMYKSTWTHTKGFTAAVFRSLQTQKLFACINTHAALVLKNYGLDRKDADLGAEWRADNAAELLAEKDRIIATYGNIPVFFTGDFNGDENEKYYADILAGGMKNVKYTATESATLNLGSFHLKPGAMPSDQRPPIDHIFVTDGVPVAVHSIETRQSALDASDHCFVYADVTI